MMADVAPTSSAVMSYASTGTSRLLSFRAEVDRLPEKGTTGKMMSIILAVSPSAQRLQRLGARLSDASPEAPGPLQHADCFRARGFGDFESLGRKLGETRVAIRWRGEKGGEVKWHSGQAAGSCRTVVDMLLVGRHVDGLIVFGDSF